MSAAGYHRMTIKELATRLQISDASARVICKSLERYKSPGSIFKYYVPDALLKKNVTRIRIANEMAPFRYSEKAKRLEKAKEIHERERAEARAEADKAGKLAAKAAAAEMRMKRLLKVPTTLMTQAELIIPPPPPRPIKAGKRKAAKAAEPVPVPVRPAVLSLFPADADAG